MKGKNLQFLKSLIYKRMKVFNNKIVNIKFNKLKFNFFRLKFQLKNCLIIKETWP